MYITNTIEQRLRRTRNNLSSRPRDYYYYNGGHKCLRKLRASLVVGVVLQQRYK